MPNKKISELEINTNPTLNDVLPIVNSGETKQISLSALTEFINSRNLANLGFIIRPRPINQNVLLPENSDVIYFGPLDVGIGYNVIVPSGSTLEIR